MKKAKQIGWFLLFTGPTLFVFFTVVILPFLMGIGYSLYRWDGIPNNPKVWVGLGNYAQLFHEPLFLQSALHTLLFTLIAVVTINLFALGFALIVTTKLKTRNVARTLFFMPNLIGGLILGFVWQFIFTNGFPAIGEALGLQGVFFNWLLQPGSALAAIVLVSTWQMAGYFMIIYIAGIQNIPEDVMEAAQVDGAGYWRRLLHIQAPLLAPAFTICLFLSMSNAFKIYDVNLSLTNGGPFHSTEMFAMNIFNEIFANRNFGYGQAKAVVFFLVVAAITLVQVYFSKRSEVEM